MTSKAAGLLDHEEESAAGWVLEHGYSVHFIPQSMNEFNMEMLQEDVNEIYDAVVEASPSMSED